MKRLRCLGRLFIVSGVALGIALLVLPRNTACAEPRSETLSLADLHFHPGPVFWPNHTPEEILSIMDRAGVRWAGNGTSGAPDDHWVSLVQTASGRFIPFAGQDPIRALILSQGDEAWNLKSPEITRYLERLEEHLRARQFRGVGELFVNNRNSRPPNAPESRYPADSPLMRRLFAFAVTYQVPLSIHRMQNPRRSRRWSAFSPLIPRARSFGRIVVTPPAMPAWSEGSSRSTPTSSATCPNGTTGPVRIRRSVGES